MRGINQESVASIFRHVPPGACGSPGIEVIAEAVEAEVNTSGCARRASLFQGCLFAPPGFETLPTARIPEGTVVGNAHAGRGVRVGHRR